MLKTIIIISLWTVSFVCFADKIEKWNVTVAQFKSTFNLNIKEDGSFDGTSDWTCCSGTVNLIDGKIKGNQITLNRHLADNEKGQTQIWKGTYINNRTKVKGNCEGLGCPLSWEAEVEQDSQ